MTICPCPESREHDEDAAGEVLSPAASYYMKEILWGGLLQATLSSQI